jgi:hypothetical protein
VRGLLRGLPNCALSQNPLPKPSPSETSGAVFPSSFTAANYPSPPALRAALKVAASNWLAPFVRLPEALALDSLRELLDLQSRFYVLERREPWPGCNWSCSCIAFKKNYRCEHMLAVAIAEGTWEPPARFTDFTALSRKRRGRPAGIGNRYGAGAHAGGGGPAAVGVAETAAATAAL